MTIYSLDTLDYREREEKKKRGRKKEPRSEKEQSVYRPREKEEAKNNVGRVAVEKKLARARAMRKRQRE